MYFLFIFLCIIILKFLLNLSRYINTCVCFKKYVSNSANLEQLIPFVEHVWDSAKTNTLVMIEYSSSTEYAKLSDLLCDISYSKRINSTFNQTIGVYKFRMLQCINPFYWIFLPRYIFSFLDVQPSKSTILLSTLAYWILSTVCAYLLELYLDIHFSDFFHNIVDILP